MKTVEEPQQEIFRHLRPRWYNRSSHSLVPLRVGGVSFLLKPASPGVYDFWVYAVPKDVEFSSRQAVKSLRDSQARNTVPFGQIEITNPDIPLIDYLVKFMLDERQVLPSAIPEQVLVIFMINRYSEGKMEREAAKMKNAEKVYED